MRSFGIVVGNRTLLAGLVITALVLFGVTVGAALTPYSATNMDFIDVLQPPSWAHPLGTDSFGRDVLTRVLVGARISLIISFSGVALATVAGTAVGMIAAWQEGAAETALMGLVDLLFAFPSFVLALLLMVILGFGLQDVVIAIALVYFPIFARLARSLTSVLKQEPYVQAARLIGQPATMILAREILGIFEPCWLGPTPKGFGRSAQRKPCQTWGLPIRCVSCAASRTSSQAACCIVY
jgi:peptide/nickel transport system permease protein